MCIILRDDVNNKGHPRVGWPVTLCYEVKYKGQGLPNLTLLALLAARGDLLRLAVTLDLDPMRFG
jgi:hypothetical protein